MEGLIEEGKEILRRRAPEVIDAAIISAAQRVEHYEIAAYGCLAPTRTARQQRGGPALQQTGRGRGGGRTLTALGEGGIKAAVAAGVGENEESTSPASTRDPIWCAGGVGATGRGSHCLG